VLALRTGGVVGPALTFCIRTIRRFRLKKIVVELSDDMTVGALRQIAGALGQELRISFAGESSSALRAPSIPRAPEAPAEQAPVAATDRERVVAALEANRWNILRTSKVLGMARNTLYTRMESWGVRPPKKR
jgi:DNA-binding NtrC family response regulator